MEKRGNVWISAVIYIALGIIAITILISAGIPLVGKVRDRNTFQQTKELMHEIDGAIQEVLSEGPGSRRYLSPVIINQGELYIRGEPSGGDNAIIWLMETKAMLLEPNVVIHEGNLKLGLTEDPILVDNYIVNITMDYFSVKEIDIDIADEDKEAMKGKNSISVTNAGVWGSESSVTVLRIDVI
ncbi:MAG: hypothetical protein ABIB47_06545 [Candidatus Woesearchaeota archaeon]